MSDTDSVFTGCIPALMTPCDANGTPDFDTLAQKGRELVDLGMKAVVYCGSMGDWPLLTDEQRIIRDSVRAWVSDRFRPIVADHFEAGTFPKEVIPELGDTIEV